MQALCELSRNQGVSVLPCAKSELDALVTGRHQGVVAVLDGTVGGEAGGMMSDAWFMAFTPQHQVQVLNRTADITSDGGGPTANLSNELQAKDYQDQPDRSAAAEDES